MNFVPHHITQPIENRSTARLKQQDPRSVASSSTYLLTALHALLRPCMINIEVRLRHLFPDLIIQRM